MVDKADVTQVVYSAIDEMDLTLPPEKDMDRSPATPLFGHQEKVPGTKSGSHGKTEVTTAFGACSCPANRTLRNLIQSACHTVPGPKPHQPEAQARSTSPFLACASG